MTVLLISQALLWVVVLGLTATVFALVRQIGVLHERVAPVGALSITAGPGVGDPAPKVLMPNLAGANVPVGGRAANGRSLLLLFVAPTCPVCKTIIPIAQDMARSEKVDVLFVGDGDTSEQRKLAERFRIEPSAYVNGPELGMALRVSKLPYAVLLDASGVIAGKGLVNNREHLESLVVARDTGFSSIQTYLRAQSTNEDGAKTPVERAS